VNDFKKRKEFLMVVVRLVFQAKSGKAGEVAEQYKRDAEAWHRLAGADTRIRILTDLSGPFDTVVQEIEVESLAEWERLRKAIFASPEFQEARARNDVPPFDGGRTEFYTLEASW